MTVCENGVCEIVGKTVEADDIVDTILLDKEYYFNSLCGVTLSDGESLLQVDFAYEILSRCNQNSIHTAIETAAKVPWKAIARVLPLVDLVFCDIKGIDCEVIKRIQAYSTN